MKINIKKIDRVPFSIIAKVDVSCPFYVGFGARVLRADGRAWRGLERGGGDE